MSDLTEAIDAEHGSNRSAPLDVASSVPLVPGSTSRQIASGGPAAWRWIHRHPLLTVAAVASTVAVLHGVWIWNHRVLGALDPDEAGYVATAFRYHRTLLTDPLGLPRAIGSTGNGPLVPLLSVPLLIIGPFDPRTVLMMQPVLMVVTAVASAGIAHRLAGSGAALVAGTVFVTLPTVVFATQTYWLGLGAATFMALAIWALLASDRLSNGWTYAFGAAVGAMLLCRTMTAGYVPAMAMAGLVVAGRRKESVVGLVKAGLVAIAVAGPWWLVARDAIFSYLFSYGYGERAGLFGDDDGPLERVDQRIDAVRLGVGLGDTVFWLVGAAALVVLWLRRRSGWPPDARHAAAVGAAVVLGIAALASTSNNGVWFELPIIALVLPLAVAIGAMAPVVVRGVAVVPVLAVGVLQLGCAWWLISPTADRVPGIEPVHRVAQYEYGFEQYDVRFGPSRRDEVGAAAADWWDLSAAVERELRALEDGGAKVFNLSGNFQLFNSNTVQLAAELQEWTPRIWIPDTVGTGRDRAVYLSPVATDAGGTEVRDRSGAVVERILVVASHDQHLFTPDAQVADLYREALDAGWRRIGSHAIPGGGRVLILRHGGAEA